MQCVLVLVLVFSCICPNQSADWLRDVTKKIMWARDALNYIKLRCPVSKEYDDILICCKYICSASG